MATPIDAIVGTSVEVQSVKTLISRVANSDVTVLIAGEPGTGKTLAAMTIHQMSRRAGESLLQFDCAATSEEFLETELFGSEGSGGVKRGLLETTNGRTILLQNIDQIPPRTQTRLLRVLQDREFQRIGGTEILPTDCRFIGTCSGDMGQMVQANLFREDLYYRLNVIFIHLPPLRERPKDIKPLLRALLTRRGVDTEQFMEKLQRQKLIEYFEKYAWPGNVKELNRVVEMAVLAERWDEIKLHLLGHTAGELLDRAGARARHARTVDGDARVADRGSDRQAFALLSARVRPALVDSGADDDGVRRAHPRQHHLAAWPFDGVSDGAFGARSLGLVARQNADGSGSDGADFFAALDHALGLHLSALVFAWPAAGDLTNSARNPFH